MKLAPFLAFAAVVYGVFGLGLFVAPAPFMAPYGLVLDATGEHMCRVLGAALLGFATAFWLSRGQGVGTLRPLLIGNLAYNVADIPTNVAAVQNGVMNTLGWIPTGLHLILALGFAWFALNRSAAA